VAGQKIALIVGAGFSTETGLPTTAQLGQLFLKNPPASRFEHVDEPLRKGIDNTISKELSEFWEATFRFRPNDNLGRSFHAYRFGC